MLILRFMTERVSASKSFSIALLIIFIVPHYDIRHISMLRSFITS